MRNLDKNVVASYHMEKWLDDKLYPGNDTFMWVECLLRSDCHITILRFNLKPFLKITENSVKLFLLFIPYT